MRNGQLIINGEIQVEPYTAEPADYTLPPLRVPPGQVFVLGDNRNKSFVCHTGLEPRSRQVSYSHVRALPWTGLSLLGLPAGQERHRPRHLHLLAAQ